MNSYCVTRDSDTDIQFKGELIAHSESSPESASGSSYSGSVGRWTTKRLYKTAKGKFICERIDSTKWQGERTKYAGAVCDDELGVIGFFGHDWVSKELYKEAGISDVEIIE